MEADQSLQMLAKKSCSLSIQIWQKSTEKTPNSKAVGLVFKHVLQVPGVRPASSSTVQRHCDIVGTQGSSRTASEHSQAPHSHRLPLLLTRPFH